MTTYSRAKIAALVDVLKLLKVEDIPEASRITVHAAVSRFAVMYEKIRNIVDYKDEHLLRKAAISRILKRRLALEKDAMKVAWHLIRELIAARYLPNGVLPENLSQTAADIIEKYRLVKTSLPTSESQAKWLFGIVSAELEYVLVPHAQDRALLNFLFESLGDKISLRGAEVDETIRRLQIYIACQKYLWKADDEMLGFMLVRLFHSAWLTPETWKQDPERMAIQMMEAEEKIHVQIHHPFQQKFLHAVKPWAVALRVLRDVLQETPEVAQKGGEHPEALHESIERVAAKQYKFVRGRLRRGIIHATVYLFITKILLAIAIELPFEQWLYRAIDYSALIVNILFPPVLMFTVGSMIRLPGKENTHRIVEAADELLSYEGPHGREMKAPTYRSLLRRVSLSVLYVLMFCLTFGAVYFGLKVLHFTIVSSAIFIFFLCVVSFFAFRLRLSAREFVVVDRRDSLTSALIDFFSLPILRAGQWFSQTVSHVNIFIFFFDFIVETPFKIFLNVMEEAFAYFKEKKEEIQ